MRFGAPPHLRILAWREKPGYYIEFFTDDGGMNQRLKFFFEPKEYRSFVELLREVLERGEHAERSV